MHATQFIHYIRTVDDNDSNFWNTDHEKKTKDNTSLDINSVPAQHAHVLFHSSAYEED